MNRLYSTLLAIPLAAACGRSGDSVSVKSIDTKVGTPYQSVASLGDPHDYPCDGPPQIQHLFNGYGSMKKQVEGSGIANDSIMKMTYTIAEAEMQRAREALDLCKKNESAPVVARPFYIMANQYAISAILWMGETLMDTVIRIR